MSKNKMNGCMIDAQVRRQATRDLFAGRRICLEYLGAQCLSDTAQTIINDCDDVVWTIEGERDSVLHALDGDEEMLTEIKFTFAEMESRTNDFLQFIGEIDWGDYDDVMYIMGVKKNEFDDFSVALYGSCWPLLEVGGDCGFDELDPDEDFAAMAAITKRVLTKTKKDMLALFQRVCRINLEFLDIWYDWRELQAVMRIITGDQMALSKTVDEVNAMYDKLFEYSPERSRLRKRFDELILQLPERVWVE